MYKIFKYARNLGVLFSVLLFTLPSAAQDIKLNATVNKNTVGLNESFQYSLQVSGDKTNLPDPALPEFKDLAILGGPNSSTSIQFINGKMSASKTLTYILQARRTGTIKIPAATLTIDNEILSSNEIEITVTNAAAQQNPQQQTPKTTSDPDISGENLFLKASANKKNVFQNEQLLITYKLYFRVSVRSYNVDKLPSNTGFWTEEFKLPSQPPIENETVNGIAYQVATLRKVALFATSSGQIEIEPMVITVDALVKRQRRSRSIFDNFFDDPFGRTVKKMVSSQPLTINVQSLPQQGRPAGFNGEVGRYSLSVNTDKTELKANEAASIKVTVSGQGNIKLLKPPEPKLPADMEIYDPKEQTNIQRDGDRVSGSKTVEYVIVPRFAGDYTIPPVSFTYFDPAVKQYKVLRSQPIRLSILPGTTAPGGTIASGNLTKQDVELLGEDIRFIKETAEFYTSHRVIYERWYYLSLYFLTIIGLLSTWFYSRKREKLRSDLQLARRKKAAKMASKRLSRAKKYLRPDNQHDFYREISLALQGFICDKLSVQMTDFNIQLVEKKMQEAGVDQALIGDYDDCLSESDFKQFSGSDSDFEEMKNFYEKSRKVLIQLDKYI